MESDKTFLIGIIVFIIIDFIIIYNLLLKKLFSTAGRIFQLAKTNPEKIKDFLPEELTNQEKERIIKELQTLTKIKKIKKENTSDLDKKIQVFTLQATDLNNIEHSYRMEINTEQTPAKLQKFEKFA